MRTNYILIDYENVQPATLASLDQEHFRVVIFIGPNQTKIALDLAVTIQRMGSRAEYVTMSSSGSNALDFHIAFYLGQLAAGNPGAYFHIISKDSGFDPLIQHLKSKKITVCRSPDITDIPLFKASTATNLAEQLEVIVADLHKRGASKPRTVQTLTSTIAALFQKQLTDEKVAVLIGELQKQKLITINETKVSYTLPSR